MGHFDVMCAHRQRRTRHALRMDACQLRLVEVAELFEVRGVRHYFEQSLSALPPKRLVKKVVEV